MSNQLQTNVKIITKRRNRALDRQGYASLLWRIVCLAFIGWFLFSNVFLITQVSGNEMFPALKDGDLVIAFRIQQTYAKSDVVVYSIDGQDKIGRIIAKETDIVTLSDSGSLLVNGTTQTEEILYPTYAKEGFTYPYIVPRSQVFILGDYRTQAKDSRDFGSVATENIKGKVITILRRRGL